MPSIWILTNEVLITIIIICENILYIESNTFLTTRNDIVTSTWKLPAFWEEIQSFSYKIKGPNWRGSNLGNNSNCCCFFHSFVYYNYMTIQKTTVHSGLKNMDKYMRIIANRNIWARLYERYIQRTVQRNNINVLKQMLVRTCNLNKRKPQWLDKYDDSAIKLFGSYFSSWTTMTITKLLLLYTVMYDKAKRHPIQL